MIRVTLPQQSALGTGLLEGLKTGAAITESPQELQAERLKNALMQQKMAQAQALLPYQEQQMGAQSAMTRYKLGHHSVMYSGIPQALLLAQEEQARAPEAQPPGISPQIPPSDAPIPGGAPSMPSPQAPSSLGGLQMGGTPDLSHPQNMSSALLNSLQARQNYQKARGDYYTTLNKTAIYRLMSSKLRDPMITQLFNSPKWNSYFKDLSPTDRNKLMPVINQAYQWNALPDQAKMARVRAAGADQTFNVLQNQYNELQQLGLQSGIPGAAQLNVGQLLTKAGKNSKFANLINQIKQTQTMMAKQFAAMGMFPNTEQGMNAADKVVNPDITKMSWEGLHQSMGNLQNLLGIEQRVLHSTSPLGQLAGTALPSQPQVPTGAPGPATSSAGGIPPDVKTRAQFQAFYKKASPEEQATLWSEWKEK